MMQAWEPPLERYLAYSEQRGRSRPPGATNEELARLQRTCQQLGLAVDPTYMGLLKKANGTGYDGLFLCGISIPSEDTYGRIDLVEQNELIDERGEDTIYGLWQDEFLVRVASTGQFERRSIVTADAYRLYPTCEAMLAAVLTEEVGYLDERKASHVAQVTARMVTMASSGDQTHQARTELQKIVTALHVAALERLIIGGRAILDDTRRTSPPDERARQARGELERIVGACSGDDLARLVRLGRVVLDESTTEEPPAFGG